MQDLHVATCGLGVDSIAGLILATKQGIIFDNISFSDPGKERKETYAYLHVINDWLLKHGQPEITVLRQVNKNGDFVGLYRDCFDRDGLPAILFGDKTCSLKFKKAPFDKWINNWEPAQDCWKAGYKVIKYIWYDADESHRTEKDYSDNKFTLKYLLVEQDLCRYDCVKIILDEGLPLPPKSSCTMCPSMKPREIIDLYENDRKEFYDAIRLERNALPNLTTVKGLGRDFSWWELIVAYRYFQFIKRRNIADANIPKRVLKLIKKINRSIDGGQRPPVKVEGREAKEIVCELFKSRVETPCECMD